MKKLLLILLLLVALGTSAQTPEKFLENSVKLETYPVILNDKVEFFDADIVNVVLAVNLGDEYNSVHIAGTYILRNENGSIFFESMHELYNSPEFSRAFSAKVVDYDDAASLSAFFRTLYNGLSFGYYFNIENKWYFTSSDGNSFFGNEGFVVSSSDNGVIEKIEYLTKIEVEMPQEAKRNESRTYPDLSGFQLPGQEEQQILQQLESKADYSFTTSPAPEYNVGNLEILDGELIVSEKYDDMESEGRYPFLIIKNGDEYKPVGEKRGLLENNLYLENLKKVYSLSKDADADSFQHFLDKLIDAEPDVKSHKKLADNTWFFANQTSFEDTLGILVMTDDNGSIKALSANSGSAKKDVMRLKMQDPDFIADYQFELLYPSDTKIEAALDQFIEVEISFNEDLVNASGAWISTVANGKPVGVSASTEMKSPFFDKIPASFFGKGAGTVEYYLMKPGDDYENPLSKITLTIIIK